MKPEPAQNQQQPAPSQALKKSPLQNKKDIQSLLEGDTFKAAVAKALPRHCTPDRFVRVALTATMRNPKLLECDRTSFFNALMTLSQFGLEPDGRNAHLIPFWNSKRNTFEITLIVDYKGLMDLAMRSGKVSNIHPDKVCENDEFEYDRGTLVKHKINFRKPRGPAYAYYSLVRFKDGTEDVEIMSLEEIEAIRKRSKSANQGPWVTDFDQMALKTVFRRHSKRLPLSNEFRDAQEHDSDAAEETKVEVMKRAVVAPDFGQLTEPAEQGQVEDAEQPAIDVPSTDVPAEPEPAQESKPEPKPSYFRDDPADVLKTILALAKQDGITQAQVLAFCVSKKLAKPEKEELAALSTQKLNGLIDSWPEVSGIIKAKGAA